MAGRGAHEPEHDVARGAVVGAIQEGRRAVRVTRHLRIPAANTTPAMRAERTQGSRTADLRLGTDQLGNETTGLAGCWLQGGSASGAPNDMQNVRHGPWEDAEHSPHTERCKPRGIEGADWLGQVPEGSATRSTRSGFAALLTVHRFRSRARIGESWRHGGLAAHLGSLRSSWELL